MDHRAELLAIAALARPGEAHGVAASLGDSSSTVLKVQWTCDQ
jgi:hypothetical protein